MLNIYYSLNRRDANRQENLKILITFTVAMLYYNFSGVRVISFVKVAHVSLSISCRNNLNLFDKYMSEIMSITKLIFLCQTCLSDLLARFKLPPPKNNPKTKIHPETLTHTWGRRSPVDSQEVWAAPAADDRLCSSDLHSLSPAHHTWSWTAALWQRWAPPTRLPQKTRHRFLWWTCPAEWAIPN